MKKISGLIVIVAILSLVLSFSAGAEEFQVIRFLNQETDPTVVGILRQWVEGFTEENPNTDIILESAPPTVIMHKISTYVQAGAPLDVIGGDSGSTARMVAEGLLEPIDEVIEALGGRDAFLPGRLLVYDDTVYAINMIPSTPVLHYRKDLFEEAGLEPPDTWEDLMHAVKTLHSDEVAGIAIPGGENRHCTIFSGIFLWQNGGDFFDRDLNVTIDNERTYEALEFYAELLQYAPPDAAGWAYLEPLESFAAGRAAMVPFWNGLDLLWRLNPDMIEEDRVGIVLMPKGKMRATERGGRFLTVFTTSEHKDLAKNWIEYMFRPENAYQLNELQPMFYQPATYEAMELLMESDAPNLQAYGQYLFDVLYPGAEHSYMSIFHAGGINPETLEIEETGIFNPLVSVLHTSALYARAVQRVAYEGWSAEDAAREAQRELEAQVEVARAEMGL